MDKKTALQKATLVIARQLEKLDVSALEAIVENESLISTLINENIGTQLRREALFDSADIYYDSLDEDEVSEAIWRAREDDDYDMMSQLCRTELERDLVAMRRRLDNANYIAEESERKYRRALDD